MIKAPFSGKGERASDLLGLIHSDVCGLMNTQARGGFQYFITFTDDFSRYVYIYLMRHKSEALERFKEFKNEVQNQHGKSIKALQSDQVEEYLSQDFDELLKECGIVSQLTPPGTRQWNGVSERRNRTLLDMVRSMMSHSDLPTSFWGHALETTVFTLNCVPSKSVQKTPLEMWTGKRPEVEQTSQVVEENSTNLETQPLRRSTRECHEPERYGFLVTTHGEIILVDQDEPKTYQEAVSSPNSEKWLEAMRSEMDSMSEKPRNATKVCKLQRSIYGLKQASRSWNLHFNDAIKEFGFIRNEDEPCVYKKDVFLVYGGEEELGIKCYTDASFQTDKDDSRSQLGFVFCLNGGAVSWKSSKQDIVVDSTIEAKYIATSEAAKEAVWIKKFVIELGVVPSISDAIELYCDNNGAIAQKKRNQDLIKDPNTFLGTSISYERS
ncbi:hypothetical protein V6N12_050710 [Hibiscus sabdariffa]|uniref:Integrase catalytic domain-containing protein n=1 Tax=Hibiscus sabdariffa TaxID=183260 RepID=A0ABR2GD67_9ROSI